MSADLEAGFLFAHLTLAFAYLAKSSHDEAERILRQLLNRSWVPGVDVTAIYNGLGDSDQAISWLDRSRRERSFDSLFVTEDPRYRSLLADPRLAAVHASTNPVAL